MAYEAEVYSHSNKYIPFDQTTFMTKTLCKESCRPPFIVDNNMRLKSINRCFVNIVETKKLVNCLVTDGAIHRQQPPNQWTNNGWPPPPPPPPLPREDKPSTLPR